MCGRYVSPEEAAIEREWSHIRVRNQIKVPNWNVAPTHRVPVLRRVADDPQGDKPELAALRWGLIPDWARGVPPKVGTIMARCEPHCH